MEVERSLEPITNDDLREIYAGSRDRLKKYFVQGKGKIWANHYKIESPLAVALCQGAAMHYHDGVNGIKDFDVWFFYPFNEKHLPYRTVWTFDYTNKKFGTHPSMKDYSGRKVDVIVRSIHNYNQDDPVDTVLRYLQNEKTKSAAELSKKAAVMISPESLVGELVWYKGRVSKETR